MPTSWTKYEEQMVVVPPLIPYRLVDVQFGRTILRSLFLLTLPLAWGLCCQLPMYSGDKCRQFSKKTQWLLTIVTLVFQEDCLIGATPLPLSQLFIQSLTIHSWITGRTWVVVGAGCENTDKVHSHPQQILLFKCSKLMYPRSVSLITCIHAGNPPREPQ